MIGDEFPETLSAARAGSDNAWTEIYRDLAPSVLGYLRGRGESDAEDLTGEVFLQVVRDLSAFEGGERDFRAWVFVIAHHRLLDVRRRRIRRPVELMPDPPADVAGAADAQEEAFQRIASAQVRGVLMRLPAEQAAVLLLRVLGQFTVDEVAGIVGKSPGAVKALQRRGLESVRRIIAKEGVPL